MPPAATDTGALTISRPYSDITRRLIRRLAYSHRSDPQRTRLGAKLRWQPGLGGWKRLRLGTRHGRLTISPARTIVASLFVTPVRLAAALLDVLFEHLRERI